MGEVLGVISGDVIQAVTLSMLLGMTVGALSDAAAPVRVKIPMLTDFLLSIWIVWIWLVIAFEICAGDLRTGYCVAAAVGALVWRRWITPVTRPLFVKLWIWIGNGFGIIMKPIKYLWKKIKYFRKKLFPTGEKWVTIGKGKMSQKANYGGKGNGVRHSKFKKNPV